ncbi:MAG: hemolysin family protein [Singulisphaera sp.]
MVSLNLGWTLGLGLPVLALHLVSVTLSRALRTYSRSRLEEVCADRGRPQRADQIMHEDERTERSAEAMAVVTGLALAALLGLALAALLGTGSRYVGPAHAVEAMVAIALGIGAVGYVMAGVVGRVFAETVLDASWPATGLLRADQPLTMATHLVETLASRIVRDADATPRPASVEVEIPSDGGDPEDPEAELPDSTRELFQRVVELTRCVVSDIMTPRSAIVALPASVSARSAAQTFRETGKSRIPLYGESRDDIIGILFAKDLFPRMTDPEGPDAVIPRDLVRPAYGVPESKNAYDLLDELRSQRTQIAIVLDEYGGVSGLISLEDLLEELVGPIDDEHDIPTPDDHVVPLDGARYEVDAALDLELLNDRLRIHLPTDGDYSTVGGFAFHALGRLPEPGDSFRHDGIEFTIVEVVEHSIRRVLVDLQPADAVSSN